MRRGRRLTPHQEQRRIAGLRILARIIVRHWLANPHLHPGGSAVERQRLEDAGEAARKEDAR